MKLTSNKLRKTLALALAVTLILGMSMTAVAEEPITEPPAEEAEPAGIAGAMGMLDLGDDSGFGIDGDNSGGLGGDAGSKTDGDPEPASCECGDSACDDCNPWVCDDCGGTMATCACCAACDSQGCELCDPSLYNCNDCRVCYTCTGNDEDLLVAAQTTIDVYNSTELNDALTPANLVEGLVINIMASFAYSSSPITFEELTTINLGGNTLTLEGNFPNQAVLTISNNATFNVTGPGTLEVTNTSIQSGASLTLGILVNGGTLLNNGAVISANTRNYSGAGLWVIDNGVATITNATAGSRTTVVATHTGSAVSATTGANVTVNGNITGIIEVVGEGTTMTINGNVTGSVSAGNEASVTVTGSATEVISYRGGTITLNGNTSTAQAVMGGITTINGNVANGNSFCVVAWHGGTVTVNGNIASTGNVAVLVIGTSNNVTVNGTISANEFIHVLEEIDGWGYEAVITAEQYDSIVNIGGTFYRQYTFNESTVLVKADDVVPSDTITEAAVNAAIAAGAPLFLTGNDTNITGDLLQIIKDSGETLEIILPNSVHISIDGKSFGNNPLPANFDLNVVLTATTTATTAGTATVPANSVIIAPATHGEFGFTINIHIPSSKLAEAGLGSGNLTLFYIDANGAISTVRAVQRQSNGPVIVSISSASQYFLSRTPSTTSDKPSGAPQTGDYRTLILPIIMITLGALGITGMVFYNKAYNKAAKK